MRAHKIRTPSLGRQVEVDEATAESMSLPRAEGDSRRHPNDASDFGRPAETQPKRKADQKTGQRWQEIQKPAFVLAEVVMNDCRRVHTHKSEQGAKVEHLGAQAVAEHSDGDKQGRR